MNVLWNLVRKSPIIWQNPLAIPSLLKELYIDVVNDLGNYDYTTHLINIAALPKSGSTWLFSLLGKIPGFNMCPGMLRPLNLSASELWNHDISQKMLDSIPKHKYTVLKLHTRPTRANLELLERNNIRTVVLIRDLRTMAVSRYRHERADKKSWCYKMYNSWSLEDGMWHNLIMVKNEYFPWVKDWVAYCHSNRDRALLVRFEDMKRSLYFELCRILQFYDLLDKVPVGKVLTARSKATGCLSKNLNRRTGARSRSTYGERYDWQEYYTDEQRKWFELRLAEHGLI